MELTLTLIMGIVAGAMVCELIDSSLGMMYGTILSPILIIAGFSPLAVVPAILFSQAIGGFIAAIFHHRLKNADFRVKSTKLGYIITRLASLGVKEGFKRGVSEDLKISFLVAFLGILATVFSVVVAISIPAVVLKTYIGVLVLAMGILLFLKASFKFSWKKILGVGILSAFNKGLSGGGFGPLVTSGQVISGRDGKSSIGATALAEAPICIVGFLTYFFTKGIPNWNLVLWLTVGAMGGAVIGPHLTSLFKHNKILILVLGFLALSLGIFVLINTWFLNIRGAGA